MASSIPRAYLKELSDALAAEPLYVALFTSAMVYTETATTNTYTTVAAAGGEVSNSGTGYTTGGYALSALTSGVVGSTNAVKVTATATSVVSATFTARYAVIYNGTSKKIRGVVDFGSDKVVTGGTFTINWDNTNGVFNITFVAA